jgi:hypothetical protein
VIISFSPPQIKTPEEKAAKRAAKEAGRQKSAQAGGQGSGGKPQPG